MNKIMEAILEMAGTPLLIDSHASSDPAVVYEGNSSGDMFDNGYTVGQVEWARELLAMQET